jgi:hypothetical protein
MIVFCVETISNSLDVRLHVVGGAGSTGSPFAPHSREGGRASASNEQGFEGLYAKTGRPSIPPERLLRAVLLQIFYTVRSERMLMEQMNYNLLFR